MNTGLMDVGKMTHEELANLACRDSRPEVRVLGLELLDAVEWERDSSGIAAKLVKAIELEY